MLGKSCVSIRNFIIWFIEKLLDLMRMLLRRDAQLSVYLFEKAR